MTAHLVKMVAPVLRVRRTSLPISAYASLVMKEHIARPIPMSVPHLRVLIKAHAWIYLTDICVCVQEDIKGIIVNWVRLYILKFLNFFLTLMYVASKTSCILLVTTTNEGVWCKVTILASWISFTGKIHSLFVFLCCFLVLHLGAVVRG